LSNFRRFIPALVALLLASTFVATSSIRLEAQGLYYDEVHQAPAAFAWLGRDPRVFSVLKVNGIPLLNLGYSGAIKSTLFGWWLRLSGKPFGAVAWRMFGVLLGGVGLLLLTGSGGRRLPIGPFILLGVLVLGDVSLLVMCRHDWGPVALAFALRALLVAFWIGAETAPEERPGLSFGMGAVVGLAIFEKLSSVVLLVPLALFVATSRRLRARGGVLATMAGLGTGLLPLAAVNLLSRSRGLGWISLGDLQQRTRSLDSLLAMLKEYAEMGSGLDAISYVMDVSTPATMVRWNAVALCAALAIILFYGARSRSILGRMAAVSALSWLGICLALWLLPRGTSSHHWIIGTPFQYVALALAAATWGPWVPAPPGGGEQRGMSPVLRPVLACSVGIVLVTGLLGTQRFTQAAWRGDASRTFSPELNTLGRFAARQGPDTVFVAADWGMALPIYCLANGRAGSVEEPFWSYRGPETLERLLAAPHLRSLFVVGPIPPTGVAPDATRRIFEDAARLEGWREVPVEGDLGSLRVIRVRRFVFAGDPASRLGPG
jgi:hypothetical protein